MAGCLLNAEERGFINELQQVSPDLADWASGKIATSRWTVDEVKDTLRNACAQVEKENPDKVLDRMMGADADQQEQFCSRTDAGR